MGHAKVDSVCQRVETLNGDLRTMLHEGQLQQRLGMICHLDDMAVPLRAVPYT